MENKLIKMFHKRIYRVLLLLFFILCSTFGTLNAQNDQLPVREYTPPEQVVSFDRTTSFPRALDVINEYAQKYRGKVVIDRTNTEGTIGISVPAMHWMDALKLILRVKELQLVERESIYEIIMPKSEKQKIARQQATKEGEGPVATTQTKEVQINAIFFEGNRRALREVGVDWSTLSPNVPENVTDYTGGGQQGGGGQGGQLPGQEFDGPFVQVNSKGAQNVSQNVFNALVNVGEIGNTGIEVQALFSAFEADNLGEILASPTIKVMDGQEGEIQVGQDFSIKQRDFAGNVVENFFSVGTILTVTPQVIEQQDTTFIHLNIDAERSTAQPDPVSTVINKQEAVTQALLLDGEATVIAGLYNTERSEVRRGVPILKDLPAWFFGLRYLFGYNSEDYQMRELVILIQASIEPTIPERYGTDKMASKFEVLKNERERMRAELQKAEKALSTDAGENQPEMLDDEDPTLEKQEETNGNNNKSTEEKEDQSQKLNQEPVTPPEITDPEVRPQKIQLDFDKADDTTQADTQKEAKLSTKEKAKPRKEEKSMRQGEDARLPYYIIGGSFAVKDNAYKLRKKLIEAGYEALLLMKQEEHGDKLYYVAYSGYESLDKAKRKLNYIQANQNSNAWLYIAQ